MTTSLSGPYALVGENQPSQPAHHKGTPSTIPEPAKPVEAKAAVKLPAPTVNRHAMRSPTGLHVSASPAPPTTPVAKAPVLAPEPVTKS